MFFLLHLFTPMDELNYTVSYDPKQSFQKVNFFIQATYN